MSELGEVARKCPSNVSSADDSNSHVDFLAIPRTVLILGIMFSFVYGSTGCGESQDGGYFSNFGNAGFI
jgi:hypothetical protein